MSLLKIIEIFRTKTMKRIAYAVLIIIILIDFFIPRHEIHFVGDRITRILVDIRFYCLYTDYFNFKMDRSSWDYAG